MKPGEIFAKTMGFVWAKLGLGLLTVISSIILFAICFGIGMMAESVLVIMMIIWFVGTIIISMIINNYFGYMIKAGHVAVVAAAVTTGSIPENQFAYAKDAIKERFVSTNVYFVIDKLVSRAVSQIQKIAGRVVGIFDSIPGVSTIKSILDMFIGISLGYIDECCLGYTFCMKGQNAYKSAADGVVIYFQNWKTLLKDAAKTTLTVIIVILVVTIASFILLGGLFKILGWSQIIAFILAVILAESVKSAFVDSWGLVNMMVSYMQVAPTTEITYDLYSKLCKMSGSFKKLFTTGEKAEAAQGAVTE